MKRCAEKIKFLIIDVDGTLTDGHIYMSNTGEAMKAFDIKDGYGISNLLPVYGIVPVIITGRESAIVDNRCCELGIDDVYQGVRNKLAFLNTIINRLDTVAYIGDDLNDIECMKAVKEAGGIVGCPCDAVKKVLEIADFISEKPGGRGAVRDFIEWIIGDDCKT